MAPMNRRSRTLLRHIARSLEQDYRAQAWADLAAGIKAAATVGVKTAYLGDGLFALEDTSG